MTFDYDSLYRETPDALGAPNRDIAAFFQGRAAPLRVLDIGCGQGRDAVPLARAGHAVVGVDLSPAGIAALTAAARSEGLNLRGFVADIRHFHPEGAFDVLLIDRTLHMLDAADRGVVLRGLLDSVAPHGWLLLLDERSNMPAFLSTIDSHSAPWHIDRHTGGLLFARRGG